MDDLCYYCQHEIDTPHHVTFYTQDHEHSELLCHECYAEWLESIKD